jgi:hypothetical protein
VTSSNYTIFLKKSSIANAALFQIKGLESLLILKEFAALVAFRNTKGIK